MILQATWPTSGDSDAANAETAAFASGLMNVSTTIAMTKHTNHSWNNGLVRVNGVGSL
jgi:hypothetical protein